MTEERYEKLIYVLGGFMEVSCKTKPFISSRTNSDCFCLSFDKDLILRKHPKDDLCDEILYGIGQKLSLGGILTKAKHRVEIIEE